MTDDNFWEHIYNRMLGLPDDCDTEEMAEYLAATRRTA